MAGLAAVRQLKTIRTTQGETLQVANQWAAEAEARDTTVSASAWEFTGGGSLAGAALSGTTAGTLLTPTGSGDLKNTVTLANGEVLIAWRRIDVDG